MRKLLVLALLPLAVGACRVASVKGSGVMIVKALPAPEFDRIEASRGVTVALNNSLAEVVVIEADSNVMPYVVVSEQGGLLSVGIDNSMQSISNMHVTVSVPAVKPIKEIKASSAAKVIGRVEGENLAVKASSAAQIELTVTAAECGVDVSSAAKVTLNGAVEKFRGEASSAASILASELTAVECGVEASSAARIEVNCSGKLSAGASSAAKVRYRGECDVVVRESSAGSVKRL